MADIEALQRRIVQLEELFSHHEHHVQQLSDVIFQLRNELDLLQVKYTAQQQQLKDVLESRAASESDDPADHKPPHY